MKTMKVLKPHSYRGKSYKVGATYPVARADIRLIEALKRGKVVEPEVTATYLPPLSYDYRTTSMQADEAPKPQKRKYTRKAKVEE